MAKYMYDSLSGFHVDELVSLEQVKEISQLDLLAVLLQDKVASLLSINSLRQDLSASHEAVDRWVRILENLYYCFRIRSFTAKKIKGLKKDRKLFLWDWSLCRDSGSRFENLVASNLLKYCHFREDNLGDDMELCFLRDNLKREIDFVVLRDGEPLFAVECKTGDKALSKHLAYFSKRTDIPYFYLVHMGNDDYEIADLHARVMPFTRFVSEVLKI